MGRHEGRQSPVAGQTSPFSLFFVFALFMISAITVYVHRRLEAHWALAYLVGVNLVASVYYGYDKAAAIGHRLRVPEVILHLLALAGGTPAAVICQRIFRHKTMKTSFRVRFWVIVAAQVAALGLWFYYAPGKRP